MKHTLLRLEPVIDTVCRLRSVRPVPRLSETTDDHTLREMLTANPAHFAAREALADRLSVAGQIGEACQLRMEGCLLVGDLLDGTDDDDALTTLDWEDSYTACALTMVYDSAADHFVIGDFEMAAAMLELAVDHDPEDHLNASELLTFCYGALEEWELFDETLQMLAPESPATRLASYWGAFRRGERNPEEIRRAMEAEAPALYREWRSVTHELSPDVQRDLASSRPSAAAEARRLWLRTEPLRKAFPEFSESLLSPETC